MKLADPNDYYADRAVEHTAQGDVYAGIPLVQATRTEPSFEITAQPPGTRGYSHEHRLMAPIVSLRELRRWGMGNNELRKIRDGRAIQGFMYLPATGAVHLDASDDSEDEWTGHAAALIYRSASVTQALLDRQPRVARLTADATRILYAAIIQTYTPNNFAWETLAGPDMSDGWAAP